MIPTITTYLYEVNRNRASMICEMERKKAFWLFCLLVALVSTAVTILIVYL
jgi:hypothetical protein